MTEWRAVLGWPDYEVSDDMRARSLDRVITRSDGVRVKRKGQLLKTTPGKRGYRVLNLGQYEKRLLAVAICEAWHGPRPSGALVRHLDDDKLNDRPWNLRWGTGLDNHLDAVRNGRHVPPPNPAALTHCLNGHEFNEKNTRVYLWRGKTKRYCRRCRADREAARRKAAS